MYGISFPMSAEAMSDNFLLPIGKCKVEREGNDLTIVAHSRMVSHSIDAADMLAKEGIKAEVINLRSIRPLDIDTIIKSVKKTNRLVYLSCNCYQAQVYLFPNRLIIVEGGFPAFGVGSEICAQIVESEAFDYLDARVERVTGADVPTPVSYLLHRLFTKINYAVPVRCQPGGSCLPRPTSHRQGRSARTLPDQLVPLLFTGRFIDEVLTLHGFLDNNKLDTINRFPFFKYYYTLRYCVCITYHCCVSVYGRHWHELQAPRNQLEL